MQIPIIKQADALRKGTLKLFGSPFTAPIWMKTHHVWVGHSMLSDNHGKSYAEYLKKFLDGYQAHGVKMWGLTTGTDPFYGFRFGKHNSMGWIPDHQVN